MTLLAEEEMGLVHASLKFGRHKCNTKLRSLEDKYA
jgi:hypothetical protein